jgi:uncharacterized coiled-coil protein SlyX
MTDLQTPLRACQSGEVFAMFDAEGNYLASIETADVAAEIVRRCNEFEALHAKYIAAEQSATVALQAQTIIGLQAKLAESERTRDLYQQAMDSMENQLDRLEEAATALTPYPEGYRPTAWEAVFELPGELRKAREKLAEAELDRARLADCLKKTNSNMEECERNLYLDINALEARAESAEAKLAAVREQIEYWDTQDAPPLFRKMLKEFYDTVKE